MTVLPHARLALSHEAAGCPVVFSNSQGEYRLLLRMQLASSLCISLGARWGETASVPYVMPGRAWRSYAPIVSLFLYLLFYHILIIITHVLEDTRESYDLFT